MARVSGTFTATGSSASMVAVNADVSVSGISSSTVLLERKLGNGEWMTGETITADSELVVENATGVDMRLRCSVFGSGTITYVMIA